MISTCWTWLWRKSIRRQLIIGVALVYLALMAVFVGDLLTQQREFLLTKACSHASARADLLAASCLHGVMANDLAGLQEIVQSMRGDRALSYSMIMDLQGRILAHTDPTKVGLYLQDETSRDLLARGTSLSVLAKTAQTIDVATPIVFKDRPLAWARLARDLSDDNAYMRAITFASIGYTLLAILIGTGVAAMIAGAILRPLQLLLRATERVSQNRLDERIPITTENEVGVVSAAFNHAMDQLRKQITEREQAEARLRTQTGQILESVGVLSAAAREISAFSA